MLLPIHIYFLSLSGLTHLPNFNTITYMRGQIIKDYLCFHVPCYENKTRSQELNLDNKCFQQSWKYHDKAVI